MPFALQVLMCKSEFLKKSTLKTKKKNKCSFLCGNAQSAETKTSSYLIYFHSANTWRDTIKSALSLILEYLAFWCRTLYHVISFVFVCDNIKHAGAKSL